MTLTMLKKWAVCLAVLLLAALCPLGAHAAESQLTLSLTVPGYPAAVADGRAEVTLPDGTTVTASGETLPDGLLFVAEPLDGEVYDWVAACLAGKGTDIRAYDLYFLDSDGSRYELSGAVTVAFSLGGAYARPAMYYVSPDGVPTQMDAAVNGEEIAFTTAHNSYYALLEQPEPAPAPPQSEHPEIGEAIANGTWGQPEPTPASGQAAVAIPATGDASTPVLWGGLLAVSGLGVAALVVWRRRRQ